MGRLARKEGWRKVNRLEEEPGRPGGRKGSTGVEVESTGDFEISLSQLETACDSQEKVTGGFLLFLLKIASILREKGQLLTLEAKRRLAGNSKVLETSGKGKGKNPPIRSGQHQ